jgi:hypothetical protein
MRTFVYGCAFKRTYPSREAAAIVLDRMKFQCQAPGRSKAYHCSLWGRGTSARTPETGADRMQVHQSVVRRTSKRRGCEPSARHMAR